MLWSNCLSFSLISSSNLANYFHIFPLRCDLIITGTGNNNTPMEMWNKTFCQLYIIAFYLLGANVFIAFNDCTFLRDYFVHCLFVLCTAKLNHCERDNGIYCIFAISGWILTSLENNLLQKKCIVVWVKLKIKSSSIVQVVICLKEGSVTTSERQTCCMEQIPIHLVANNRFPSICSSNSSWTNKMARLSFSS